MSRPPKRGGRSFKQSTDPLVSSNDNSVDDAAAILGGKLPPKNKLPSPTADAHNDVEHGATVLLGSGGTDAAAPDTRTVKSVGFKSEADTIEQPQQPTQPPPRRQQQEVEKQREEEDIAKGAAILSGKSPKAKIKTDDLKVKPKKPSEKEEKEREKEKEKKKKEKREKEREKKKMEKIDAEKRKKGRYEDTAENSDDDLKEHFQDRKKKKQHKLSVSYSSSLSEAKSKQRLAYQQQQSMKPLLKLPNANEYPLLHAAATGDTKSLLKLANKFTSSSDMAIAALRADSNKVTALHYAAYFHQLSSVKLLLNLACEKIRSGIQAEIDELVNKRVRFLEETKYAYNNAMNAIDDENFYEEEGLNGHDKGKGGSGSAGVKSNTPAQIIEDAVSFEQWCSNEITRLLRTRELRCEAQWTRCLTAVDNDSRTCLHYCACNVGGDEVAEAIIVTGRAKLSGAIPPWTTVDVVSFIEHNVDLTTAMGTDFHADKKRPVKKGAKNARQRENRDKSLRFVSPPCNSTSSHFAAKYAEMKGGYNLSGGSRGGSRNNDGDGGELFPRDDLFHSVTGQLKNKPRVANRGGQGREKTSTNVNSMYALPLELTREEDQIKWWCGRLLDSVKKRKISSNTKSGLTKIFKEKDTAGYGCVTVDDLVAISEEARIDVDEDFLSHICRRFQDVRNRVLTCKWGGLVSFAVENASPIARRGEEEKEEGEGEEKKEADIDDGDEEEKETWNDDANEEKKSEILDEEEMDLGYFNATQSSDFTSRGSIREARCVTIDSVDNAQRTALHVASSVGDARLVSVLTKYGASRELRASDGQSALSYANSSIVRSKLLNGLLGELNRMARDNTDENNSGSQKKIESIIVMLCEGGLNVNDPLGGLDLQKPIHVASVAGLVEVVENLLEKRSDPNATDGNGWTALHHVAVRGGGKRRAIATVLLSSGAEVDARTSFFRTALHLCCIGKVAIKDFASKNKYGASNNGGGGDGVFAAENGGKSGNEDTDEDTKMISLLVNNGADINARDEGGCTPLHRAAEQGRVSCIASLIKNGADIYALTPHRWNALHFAAFAGHINACRLLSQVDAEKGLLAGQRDARRCSPSDVADDEETRRSLRTIWVAARDNDIDTLVKCISLGGKEGMSKMWLPAGIEDKTKPSGYRVLHSCVLGHDMRMKKLKRGVLATKAGRMIAKQSVDKTVQTVCLLLDKHAYVNSYDSVCRTPLHFASAFGMIPLIDVLVGRGADLEAKDCLGSTPLHYAYAFGQMKSVVCLQQHGAEERVRNFCVGRKRVAGEEEEEEENEDGSDGEGDSDSYGDDDSSDGYSDCDSDDSAGGGDRRQKSKRRKSRSRRRKGGGGKGRLPRECAGFKQNIFPLLST